MAPLLESPAAVLQRKARAAKITAGLRRLFPVAQTALKHTNTLELLIAVILSAQCTDAMVNKVTEKLFKKYRTLDDYLKANPAEFEQDIKSIGLYRAKAKNILAAVRLIKEQFSGRVPQTMAELLTLPGVARKTANVVMASGFGVAEGIAVDTHMRRLTRLWGLTSESDPVKIERDLMMLLPKKEWVSFNHRVVEYGRRYCTARTINHVRCPLRAWEQQ